jgi:hypothetical protein
VAPDQEPTCPVNSSLGGTDENLCFCLPGALFKRPIQ